MHELRGGDLPGRQGRSELRELRRGEDLGPGLVILRELRRGHVPGELGSCSVRELLRGHLLGSAGAANLVKLPQLQYWQVLRSERCELHAVRGGELRGGYGVEPLHPLRSEHVPTLRGAAQLPGMR